MRAQRYREILQGAADGKPYRVIAEELGLKLTTVKQYAMGMMAELGADSITHAVAQGFRRGLVE